MPSLRRTPAKKARAQLRSHLRRLSALSAQASFLEDLAGPLAPADRPSAWPCQIQELADKIQRQGNGALLFTETPVRDKDRQMLKHGLPRGIVVAMNDPSLDGPRRSGDPQYC